MKMYRYVDDLRSEFAMHGNAIRARLADFAAVSPGAYFYELAYCLLTPQSSAVNATRAVEALQAIRFFDDQVDAVPILRSRDHYIRFHNTKGRHLREARQIFPEILLRITDQNGHSRNPDGPALRLWLTAHVRGLGWKEASHFLRNIGYTNLAILDRHILKNLQRHGVVRTLPQSLTPKRYADIEKRFARFAATVGVTMDELDLLFWSRETGEIRK